MGTIYNKPGWEMRLAAFRALAEYADYRRVRRKKRKPMTPAQRAAYRAIQERHPEYGAPSRTRSRLPKAVRKCCTASRRRYSQRRAARSPCRG
jgi:hypothetical protein